MSEIRKMLVETANKILKDFCTKVVVIEAEKGIWPVELWNVLEETGMTLAGIPEEMGGVGGDVGDAMSLIQLSGKYAAPIPLAESFIANWLLGLSEQSIHSEAVTVGPVRKDDRVIFSKTTGGWIVTGQLRDIPWARAVKELVVLGKTDEGDTIVSTILLENCLLHRGENMAGESRDEVSIPDLFITDDHVIINPPVVEEDFWNLSTLTRVALMAGALERVLEMTVDYANERSQFGRAIGKFQAVKQHLAVMGGEVSASSIATESAVAAFCNGNLTNEIVMAKIQVGDAAGSVTKIAHQVHGAMGFTDEHPLHLNTRRLWSWRDEYGTESQWAEYLGGTVLEIGSANLWPMITSTVIAEKIN
jgi:acyl-CoA dehydrogenase